MDVLRICDHESIYLGWLMKALHKFFVVEQFVLISLSAGEQELGLRLRVVFVALHGLQEVSLGDDTCVPVKKSTNRQNIFSLHVTLDISLHTCFPKHDLRKYVKSVLLM